LYPETKLTQGVFYNSESEFIQAANDVYRQLNRIYDAHGIPDLYGELFSDNGIIVLASGANSWYEDINKHRIKTDNGRIETAWQTSYNAIYLANNVIDQLDKTTVSFSSDILKQRLRAEALFVRSVIYFNLVQAFGDIPLLLRVVSPDDSYDYIRIDKNTVYEQLIVDLSAARDILPESYTGNDVGRITKYAAAAVLAKTCLLAGRPDQAKIELERIISSGLYSLDANKDGVTNADDYSHLFQPATKNSKESVFEIQYLTGINQANSEHQTAYAPYSWAFHLPNSVETFRGYGYNTPSDDLIGEYESGDPRKDLSIYPGFVDLDNNNFVDYPFTVKYYDPNWQYPGQNYEAIRYADILLLYSEITNDPLYLNQVRARAGLPEYGSPDYPARYSTLALAIEHERRIEFAFEFHRMFDLVRTGRAINVLKEKGYDLTTGDLLFPIPQIEIDINPDLTQNEAYKR
jgi:hypothetical protein